MNMLARRHSEDEVGGFCETLPQPVLSFVLDFAVVVLDVFALTVQESHIQPSLIFAHVISQDEVAGFPGLFLQPDYFAHDARSEGEGEGEEKGQFTIMHEIGDIVLTYLFIYLFTHSLTPLLGMLVHFLTSALTPTHESC